MHRIDHPTAAVALPAPSAAGTPGYFTVGNPSSGVPATVVTSEWANAVQEELIHCLDAAGIAPDKQSRTQLWAAIQIAVGAAGGVPDASTSVKGKVELATSAEATTGTATDLAVTPAGVAAAIAASSGVPDGTTTVKGKVRLATVAETISRQGATWRSDVAVTPDGLNEKFAGVAYPPAASTTVTGVVELATDSETIVGADVRRVVTPSGVAAAIAASRTAATATAQGIIELATNDEAIAGVDSVRAVTPAGLSASIASSRRVATTDANGVVELATSAESVAGTDTSRAVTPAGLASAIAASASAPVPQATDTVAGRVELATTAEAVARVDATRAVTPAGLGAAIAAAAPAPVPYATYETAGVVEFATGAETQAGADGGRAVSVLGAHEVYAKLTGANFGGQTSAPTFNTGSAMRKKRDVVAFDPAEAATILQALQVVAYTLIADGTSHVGVIADWLVGTPLEFAVMRNADGEVEAVDYTSLFAIAMAAQQGLAARIDQVEARLSAAGF